MTVLADLHTTRARIAGGAPFVFSDWDQCLCGHLAQTAEGTASAFGICNDRYRAMLTAVGGSDSAVRTSDLVKHAALKRIQARASTTGFVVNNVERQDALAVLDAAISRLETTPEAPIDAWHIARERIIVKDLLAIWNEPVIEPAPALEPALA